MDRIAELTAFTRVVEAGSFTKAADTLQWPKATVTRLIQALETELGVRLLQRTTRSISVTVEGAAFYERVVPLLADLHEMDAGARGRVVPLTGRVRVSTPHLLAAVLLAPALPDFHARHPGIEVEVLTSNRLADLIADHVDCAIRVGHPRDASVAFTQLGAYRLMTCASPAYLARHGLPQSPGDLADGHATLGLASGLDAPVPFQFAREGQANALHLQPEHVLYFNDSNAYLAAGLNGLGILQLASWVLQSLVERGELVPILQDWSHSPPRPVHLARAGGRQPTAAARAFMDWVIEVFRSNAVPGLVSTQASEVLAE